MNDQSIFLCSPQSNAACFESAVTKHAEALMREFSLLVIVGDLFVPFSSPFNVK